MCVYVIQDLVALFQSAVIYTYEKSKTYRKSKKSKKSQEIIFLEF